MIECWVNGQHFDHMGLAADFIGVSATYLSKRRDSGRILITHQGKDYEVTFYPPPTSGEIPPSPPHIPGTPLLAPDHCVSRSGVYRGERV